MAENVGDGVYRNVRSTEGLMEYPDNEDIKVMPDFWKNSCEKFAVQKCMGSREILSMRKDGKMEKYVLGPYSWITYRQAKRRTDNFGRGLASLGLKKGHIINFFADTKKEWQLAALGCYGRGFVVATTYANLGPGAVEFGITQTETEVVFTDADLVPLVNGILKNCPKVKHVVFIPDQRPASHPSRKSDEQVRKMVVAPGVQVHSMEEVEKLGEGNADLPAESIQPSDLCMIMYTSGSTANPKGVMITHENMVSTVSGVCDAIPGMGVGDFYVAYLPLAHILEVCAETGCLATGVAIGYGTPKTITDNSVCIEPGQCKGDASELRPTLMAAVPMIMDKIRKAVTAKVDATGGITKKMFHSGYEKKQKALADGLDTPFWNKILFDKIRAKLLGGRLRYMLSGGGPLSKETQEFMNIVFCCPVGQGFGMTETVGAATIVWPNDRTFGRVGAPIRSMQLKLVDWEEGGYYAHPADAPAGKQHPNPRGEILLGGKQIVKGYFKLPEVNAETFFTDKDGVRWLRSGDIGEIFPDGVLAIIDRKKDLVKLSGGEYVSYGKLEPILRDSVYIDNGMMYAEPTQSYSVAIVTRPPDSDPVDDKVVLDDIASLFKKNGCAKFEIPKKIFVSSEVWGPENDLCTAALKLKRNNLRKFYQREIDNLYA
mmetsp:Transcript_13092/g.28313  ORF Transcript_13092/g.28313 Transcript_13092/m.28313 type:complete len:657 (-) Transcript_13092:1511-3481(-)